MIHAAIERCLEDQWASLAYAESSAYSLSSDRRSVLGALEAFVEVGLLTGRDFEVWKERLWRREPATVASDELGSQDVVSRSEQTQLLRVVPGPAERIAGLRVTVIELYADGVSVQWHLAPDSVARRHLLPVALHAACRRRPGLQHDPPVRLADDVGTTYVWHGGASADGSRRRAGVLGHTDFAPGVSEQARRLLVSIGDQALPVPLP